MLNILLLVAAGLLKALLVFYIFVLGYRFVIQKYLLGKGRADLKDKSLMVVIGSGGHTTEMLMMLETLTIARYGTVHFVLGHSDSWSPIKIKDFYLSKEPGHDQDHALVKGSNLRDFLRKRGIQLHLVYRAREVKQSYITSVATTLLALLHATTIVARTRPDLIVTNGPGTAVPLCYANFFIQRVLLLKPGAKLLFVESFCRVKTLSLTGKLLRPIADKFIVQWPELYTTLVNEKDAATQKKYCYWPDKRLV